MKVTETRHLDILAWVRGHCEAWNRNDVRGMFVSTSPDMHWVNVVGMHWRGRDAAIHAHEVFFAAMFRDVALTLEGVESIVSLPDGARVAVVRWALGDYRTPPGEPIQGERNRMTMLFSGAGDTLTVHHIANIRIDEAAAAHDPVAAMGATGVFDA